MADQMYSMCWAPQYQEDVDQNKIVERSYPRHAPGNSQDYNTENIGCVQMPADSVVSQHCKTPGYCINGKPISLKHLAEHGLECEVPAGMVLAGAKSPLLGKTILVAAVDKRFLPCDASLPTTLGFSGSCIGCGDPAFRYFTEFSNHINLFLATQPKKQKHLKVYILRDNLGRLCRGPKIPWRDTPLTRKRPNPYPEYPSSIMDGQPPRHVTSDVTSSSFASPSSMKSAGHVNKHYNNTMATGRSSTSSQSSCDSGSSGYDYSNMSPMYKRTREDVEKEGEASPPQDWLENVCGFRPVLVTGYPTHIPHFLSGYKAIVISDMLAECFEALVSDSPRPSSTSSQFMNRQYNAGQQSTRGAPYSDARPDSNGTSSTLSSSSSTRHGGFAPVGSNVLVLLMTQYLSQLSEDITISKEDFMVLIQNSKEQFWQTSQENSSIQSYIHAIDASNLVHLASLTTLPSNGSVKLISSVVSLSDAINKGLGFLYQISKHNQQRETKLQVPHYLMLVFSPPGNNPEFCVMVTGINQAKLLHESVVRDESVLETPNELNQAITTLNRTYQMLNITIHNLIKQFEQTIAKTKLVFLPFNGNPTLKIPEHEAVAMSFKKSLGTSSQFSSDPALLHRPLVTTAHRLLSCVLGSKDGVPVLNLRHFCSVDFSIIVPSSATYFQQVLHQVDRSGVLLKLGLGPPTQSQDSGFTIGHVIQNNSSETSELQFKDFLSNAKSCPEVLFVLICDQSHQYITPYITTDTLPHFDDMLRQPNIIVILNTPIPYRFQTRQSRIRVDNEVFWNEPVSAAGQVTSSEPNPVSNPDNVVHFGISDYMESLNWTHQIPLIREDDEFEDLALKANLLTNVTSRVVRGYLLVHHYTTAIMWSAGMLSMEPHCTFKTLQVIRDIVESPLRSTEGRGAMLVIRVPCGALAAWTYQKLRDTRDSVGFRYRFAVVNDDGESGLQVEEYFLQRLRSWQVNKGDTATEDWYPKCYEDLLDLPCIVLVSGRDRPEDAFPRSLKYCDLRLLHDEFSHRSTLELELNVVSRYFSSGLVTTQAHTAAADQKGDRSEMTSDKAKLDAHNQFCSSYPLPVLLVSRTGYRVLQKDFFGCPKHLRLGPDTEVVWNSDQRPALVSDLPSEQANYYRHWTKPREKVSRGKDKGSCEVNTMKQYPRCFLFSGPPQVGTMPSILHFVQLLYGTLLKLRRVDVYDEVPDPATASKLLPATEMDQPSPKILSTIPFNPCLIGPRFASVSAIHTTCARNETGEDAHDVRDDMGNDDKRDVKNDVLSDIGDDVANDTSNGVVSGDVISLDPPTSSVMMSSFAAFDSYHHCDECKNYCEGLGTTSKYPLTLGTGEQLMFVIPGAHRQWFTFGVNNELHTLKLPLVTTTSEGWKVEGQPHCDRNFACKTPIFTPSTGRHEQGLINLFHAMEGRDHVHFIFVKNNELLLYQKIWPNHVIVGLPPSCSSRGLGMTKHIMKEFATHNLLAERRRQRCDSSSFVWPFVHFMDDSCVMWQCQTVDDGNSFQEDGRPKHDGWSLLQTTRLIESSPNISSLALVGFNHWGSANIKQYKLNSYSVSHVHSTFFLNVDVTHHVSYNQRLFTCEQVDFNLRVTSHKGLVVRYDHVTVLKKRIPIGGGRGFHVPPNIDDIISLPDRDPEHVTAAPAHFLLEEYLRLKAADKIFPAASANPQNPVLLLNCFINLGPRLHVRYKSTMTEESSDVISDDVIYGGVLLYLCGSAYHVSKQALRDLRFCPGAKICVVSSDRSTLRDQVVKLDLEEHWRFRLRDEFKTASSLGDEALYFLTGTFDG